MNLTERIAADMKEAMKAGRKLELETLRTIRAAILEFEKKQVGAVLKEDDELQILSAAAKKRREAIEQYRNAGRADLADQEESELGIITRYLPAQLSGEELAALIDDAISETGAKEPRDLGKVMGLVMKHAKGRADGALIQTMVKQKLGAA